MRWSAAAISGFVLVLVSSASRADGSEPDPSKVRCKASYESAQVLKREEHLDAARTQLLVCKETCPAPLVQECTRWDTEIDTLMPTVRLIARDASGAAVVDVRVLVDGRVLASTDAPVSVDPGAHVFRFEPRTGRAIETRVEVHAGERGHEIAVTLDRVVPPAPVAARAVERSRTPSWILGGAGAVMLAASGVLAIKGQLDRGSLRSDCAPSCDASDVDAIRTTWWVSAGLGVVGATALVVAVVLWPRASGRISASAHGVDVRF